MSSARKSDTTRLTPTLASSFPFSTAQPSAIFHFPGGSAASGEMVRRVLTENDHKYDIYESARYAHNHFSHSVLTRYALGAPSKLLQDTWEHDRPHLVSLDPEAKDRETDMEKVPEVIDESNWDDPRYLGYDGCYSRYLGFFHGEIAKLGPKEVLEKYVFSAKANWEGRRPRMLLHLLGGFWHPMIHTGLAIEFRDSMLLAEGLAEACIHKIDLFETLVPSDWPASVLSASCREPSAIPDPQSNWNLPPSSHTPKRGRSLLDIYNSICSTESLAPIPYNPDSLMRDRMLGSTEGNKGSILREMASDWSLTDEELGEGPEGWEAKVGELGVFNTLIACATGREGKETRIDFFLMHALTSSLFLPSYLPLLTIPQRRALLTIYTLVTLQSAIARGRPRINPGLLMNAPLFPVAPDTSAKSARDVLSDPAEETSRNAWLSLVESALYAEDSHVPKSIRSLLYWSTKYSHLPAGGLPGSFVDEKGKEESIKGMKDADGTIFMRAAGLIMSTLGWCREGQKVGNWDFSALGYDETWED